VSFLGSLLGLFKSSELSEFLLDSSVSLLFSDITGCSSFFKSFSGGFLFFLSLLISLLSSFSLGF